MWQIPIDEINRPGNFSSHARSCLELLVSVLVKLKDLTSLLYITQQLKSKPDSTKQFMREIERPCMHTLALQSCIKVLKSIVHQWTQHTINVPSNSECHKLLMEANTIKNLLSKAREDSKVLLYTVLTNGLILYIGS
jgi:calcineurin-binding protein cabin-1